MLRAACTCWERNNHTSKSLPSGASAIAAERFDDLVAGSTH